MMKDQIVEVLTTTLQKSQEEVAELLKEGEDGTIEIDTKKIIDLYGQKRQSLIESEKEKAEEKAKNFYSKGAKEMANTYTTPIKQLFGLEDNFDSAEALLEAVKQKQKDLLSKKPGEQVEIEKLPEFIEYQNKQAEKLKEVEQTWEQKLKELQDTYKKKEVFSVVSDKAMNIFDQYEYSFDNENPALLGNNRNEFIRRVSQIPYLIGEDGNPIPLDSEGKRLEDANGNAISFESICRTNIENYIPLAKSKPRQSGGGTGGSPEGHNFKMPKDENEYTSMLTQMMKDGEPIEKRNAFIAQWKNKQ